MEKVIILNNGKVTVKVVNKFKKRIKGFRFYLANIKEGLCYPRKKMINTYFNCQRLDIIVTDKSDKILAIYRNMKTEKFIRPRLKAYYIYLLPVGCADGLEISEKLKVVTK